MFRHVCTIKLPMSIPCNLFERTTPFFRVHLGLHLSAFVPQLQHGYVIAASKGIIGLIEDPKYYSSATYWEKT